METDMRKQRSGCELEGIKRKNQRDKKQNAGTRPAFLRNVRS